MMAGLITINKLMYMLLQELRAFNFYKYQELLLKKARITWFIKKRNYKIQEINELSNELLPEQIGIVSYYAERLPRVKRIVEILRRGKGGINKAKRKEYEELLRLLNILILLARKNLKGVLEEQKKALDEQDLRKYLKFATKEYKIGYKFSKPFSRLGYKQVEISKGRIREITGIEAKRLFFIRALISLIFIATFTSLPLGIRVNQALQNPTNFVMRRGPISICAGQIGIELGKSVDVQDSMKIINKYFEEDLKKEIAIEVELESLTGVQILGDYTKLDLISTKDFLEATYGYNINQFVKSITYLPPNARFFTVNKCLWISGKKSYFGGIALRQGHMLLMSIENWSVPDHFRVLAHEFTHYVHHKVERDFPEFNKQWDKIKGGYAREYGRTNRNEDIATVAEEVIHRYHFQMPIYGFMPIDGNYEAFRAKVRLLKAYNILPPVVSRWVGDF